MKFKRQFWDSFGYSVSQSEIESSFNSAKEKHPDCLGYELEIDRSVYEDVYRLELWLVLPLTEDEVKNAASLKKKQEQEEKEARKKIYEQLKKEFEE